MKIAIWHNLPSGGGKRALYYHVRGLLERGHTIESWCPSTIDQAYLPLNTLITEHMRPFSWSPKTAKTSLGWMFANYKNLVNKVQAMDEHCRQCAEEINQGGFDILFANACEFFRVASIARYVNIPKVIYLGEPYRWLYEALPQSPWLAYPPPRRFWWSPGYLKLFLPDLLNVQRLRVQAREEFLNAKAFDLILVNSLYSRESVLRAYGLEAKVCYLGIDIDLFHPVKIPRKKFVVGLGGIYRFKGIERAIRAIGTIEERVRPPLIWVGNFLNEQYYKEMEILASSLKVNLQVKVRVPDEEVVRLLSQAFVMLYTPFLEPFGFAPLEANACATPVVAIAEGGVRESIQEGVNGFLIEGSDPVKLGRAVLHLLENPELVKEIGENARKYVQQHWNWKPAIDKLERYLLDLVKNPPHTDR